MGKMLMIDMIKISVHNIRKLHMTYPNYTGLTDPKVDKEYLQTVHLSDLAMASIEYGVIRNSKLP